MVTVTVTQTPAGPGQLAIEPRQLNGPCTHHAARSRPRPPQGRRRRGVGDAGIMIVHRRAPLRRPAQSTPG